jgi:hypothetical protein
MVKQTVYLFLKALIIGILINIALTRNADRPLTSQNATTPEQIQDQLQQAPSNVKVQLSDQTDE